MSAKKKGFQRPAVAGQRQNKPLTKAQLQEKLVAQVEQNTQMLNKVQMTTFQITQQFQMHLQQLQGELIEVATLARMRTVEEGAKLGDRVIIDCITREYNEDGSLSQDYVPSMLLIGAKIDVIQDENVHYFPTLVENLLGKKCGDVFTVDVEVPERYEKKDLVGKKLNMDVTVVNVFRDCGDNNYP